MWVSEKKDPQFLLLIHSLLLQSTLKILSLLNNVPRVSKIPSSARVPLCLIDQVARCLECVSVQVPLECPSPQVPFNGPWSAQLFFECSLSKKSLEHYTRNGLVNSFYRVFKNFSEYILLHNTYCFLLPWKQDV